MKLRLLNTTWFDGDHKRCDDISIREYAIDRFSRFRDHEIDARDLFAYPGLVNAHDHLEMNLYSRLGTPPYDNYVQWANDIYKPATSPLREIERVPIVDRRMWGGLKNLIGGVSWVAHHNPWHRLLGSRTFPVRVLSRFGWAHSLAFEKKIRRKAGIPFFIHAAEGIDRVAATEIDALDAKNLLDEHTIIIHAVGVTDAQIEKLKTRKSSAVWCPASNMYMFGRTAPVKALNSSVRLALGSDSTLTGSPHFLDELKAALNTGCLSADEIFQLATSPEVFNAPGISARDGDFFIARKVIDDYRRNLFAIKPEDIMFVFTRGKIKMTDTEFTAKPLLAHSFRVNGKEKRTYFDVQSLRRRIVEHVGGQILGKNELWNVIS